MTTKLTVSDIRTVDYETFVKNTKIESRIAYENRADCYVCGRPVNRNTCKNWIEHTISDELIPAGVSNEDSQGCFPVGSECINLIPKEYRIKLSRAGA